MNLINYHVEPKLLHSGRRSHMFIDCDALSDADIISIAQLVVTKVNFCAVYGIPTGGDRMANALKPYRTAAADTVLVVDDVLTTGNSMAEGYQMVQRQYPGMYKIRGFVIFARCDPPSWITALLRTWE